jgi:hypothetical protein
MKKLRMARGQLASFISVKMPYLLVKSASSLKQMTKSPSFLIIFDLKKNVAFRGESIFFILLNVNLTLTIDEINVS